jgi:hypothetical protein
MDSAAGFGALASLPERPEGFTMAELEVNLVATTGGCDAFGSLVHSGRRCRFGTRRSRVRATDAQSDASARLLLTEAMVRRACKP